MVAATKTESGKQKLRLSSVAPLEEGKLVSIFEPETEVIRKVRAHKPNEFGKPVRFQKAEKFVSGMPINFRNPINASSEPDAEPSSPRLGSPQKLLQSALPVDRDVLYALRQPDWQRLCDRHSQDCAEARCYSEKD